MHGIRTQVHRIVGVDKTTEPRRPPKPSPYFISEKVAAFKVIISSSTLCKKAATRRTRPYCRRASSTASCSRSSSSSWRSPILSSIRRRRRPPRPSRRNCRLKGMSFLNGPTTASFIVYFWYFQTNTKTIFTTNICEKMSNQGFEPTTFRT